MTLFIDRRRGKSRDEAAQLAKLYILAIYGLPYLSDCILIVRALNVFGGGKMTVAADVIDAILRHDRRAPKKIGTPTSIRREVDASLRRLGIERIDLYQMHWPPEDGTPLEGYWQTLLDLKAEGKVRAVGLSNHDTAQLEDLAAVHAPAGARHG